MLMTCMRRTCSTTLTQKHETEKQSTKKKPNSNNLACLEHENKKNKKKNYKTNLSKHI